ncbi:hypothetical protein FRB96_008414 [Tulasnella sp. 330]|nr:hypothetical protein FRB96_008414 [Tulasnella sp. 330]KAG8880454.1 hypothetical protein FRB97_000755 [Tulasnella sp. 331]
MSTKFDAENAENLEEIEKQWAVKAVEQAQVYWNLLAAIPPRSLRLTKIDDEIFEDFSNTFPEFIDDDAKLMELDEDTIKNKENKERWRNFMMRYEKTVKDFNFGTMVRPKADEEYGQENSMFVPRMQFYAIEIARNRLGLNDAIHVVAKKDAEETKAAKALKKAKKTLG